MSSKDKSGFGKLLDKFTSRRVIVTTQSKMNPVLEVVEIGGRLMLNSANTNYSFGGLHRVFQKVFSRLDIQSREINDVLILGFGAGSVASILREELSIDCRIVGVEKDEKVLDLAKMYFNVDRFSDLELVEEDAARFMRSKEKKYDLILVDVYADFEVPASCETPGFISDLERCLAAGGMVIFNKLVYNHEAGDQAKEIARKFRKFSGTTKMIKVKENIVNRVIVYEDRTPKNDQRTPSNDQRTNNK